MSKLIPRFQNPNGPLILRGDNTRVNVIPIEAKLEYKGLTPMEKLKRRYLPVIIKADNRTSWQKKQDRREGLGALQMLKELQAALNLWSAIDYTMPSHAIQGIVNAVTNNDAENHGIFGENGILFQGDSPFTIGGNLATDFAIPWSLGKLKPALISRNIVEPILKTVTSYWQKGVNRLKGNKAKPILILGPITIEKTILPASPQTTPEIVSTPEVVSTPEIVSTPEVGVKPLIAPITKSLNPEEIIIKKELINLLLEIEKGVGHKSWFNDKLLRILKTNIEPDDVSNKISELSLDQLTDLAKLTFRRRLSRDERAAYMKKLNHNIPTSWLKEKEFPIIRRNPTDGFYTPEELETHFLNPMFTLLLEEGSHGYIPTSDVVKPRTYLMFYMSHLSPKDNFINYLVEKAIRAHTPVKLSAEIASRNIPISGAVFGLSMMSTDSYILGLKRLADALKHLNGAFLPSTNTKIYSRLNKNGTIDSYTPSISYVIDDGFGRDTRYSRVYANKQQKAIPLYDDVGMNIDVKTRTEGPTTYYDVYDKNGTLLETYKENSKFEIVDRLNALKDGIMRNTGVSLPDIFIDASNGSIMFPLIRGGFKKAGGKLRSNINIID